MNSGGTATYLNTLIPELNRTGIEAHLAFGNIAKGESEDISLDASLYTRISSLHREVSPRSDLRAAKEFDQVVKAFSPDIIHSHAFKGGVISRLLVHNEAKRIHTFHGHHLYDPEFSRIEKFAMNRIEKWLNRKTDGFIFIGKRVKSELQDRNIGNSDFSVSIAPGIRLGSMLYQNQALDKLGINPTNNQSPVFLWMGRFIDVKNPEMFLELARTFSDSIFIMAGDGPKREHLELNAPGNLRLVGWQQRELLLSATDVVVSTSLSEGMPLSLIEAQMSGRPVIAPNVGSIAEIVEDGSTGFIFDGNLSDLRDKSRVLIDNLQLRNEMSERAKSRAEIRFSAEALLAGHEDFYRKVIGK